MSIELKHEFTTTRSEDENYELVLDLDRLVPCVSGGKVVERVDDRRVNAEIAISMGVMSLTFAGEVAVLEQDPDARRVLIGVQSAEISGDGEANAKAEFVLTGNGGTIAMRANLTGTAMSMGEAIPAGVLDALIEDFLETFTDLEPVAEA